MDYQSNYHAQIAYTLAVIVLTSVTLLIASKFTHLFK